MLVYGLVVALGAIYVGTGLVSLRAQPRNRIGVLMTLIGAAGCWT